MQLSVSLVTYKHTFRAIEPCLHSVLNSSQVSHFYIIDHSPHPQLGHQLPSSPRIIYLHKANKGFGAGHNVAIRLSLKQGIPYHLIVNPDVWFAEDTIEQLLSLLQSAPQAGLVTPRILYPDGSLQYHCKLLPTPWDWFVRGFCPIARWKERLNERFELKSFGYNQIVNIPYLNGSFMLFRNQALKEVGLFDEAYFMYSEDCDITRRIHTHWQTLFYPKATITHAFNRESHRNLHLFWIQIKSTIHYFNKWGWWIDPDRNRINKATLHQLEMFKSASPSTPHPERG